MTLLQTQQAMITQDHLVAYYELMIAHNDEKNATKILELYEKLNNHTYIISFTGHFSAGKSSMINALLGKEILPKSPIPTSGNIVEITSGEGFARVFFNDDTSVLYEEPYDIELIQDFCKDNQSVKKVALNTSKEILPKGCMIVDTPGIDAADDADRLMTESSLHLVDRLFYVMDYNHVQSEVNLHFLKQIQTQEIPFYVIINQVDKHDEAEISFKAFTESIKQTFNQWGVNPEEIFYSSLIDQENKHNQFHKIKKHLYGLLSVDRDTNHRIDQSVGKIISDHKIYLQEIFEQESVDISTVNIEGTDTSTYEDIKKKLADLKRLPVECKRTFQEDLNQTLKNAYLMPATLREMAELFLESRQKDFKIGLFGARKKTSEERALRLDNFLRPLQKNIEATIQWNFRDKVIALLTKYNLGHPELIQFTQQLSIEYTEENLISIIKPGAQINGGYVLNYTNDVSTHIKSKYKTGVWLLWDKIEAEIVKQTDQSIAAYEKKFTYLEDVLEQKEQQTYLQTQLEEKYKQIDDQLNYPTPKPSSQALIENIIQAKAQSVKSAALSAPQIDEKTVKETHIEKEQSINHGGQSIGEVTYAIDQTINTIEGLPGFQTLLDDLRMKKEKLTNRTLTIALFGAFSAGKSSFANALLGEGLLPASPNPTTAVINRISPITKEYGHGIVVIHIKDEQSLINDLSVITKDLSPPKTDLDGLISWIKAEKIDQNDALDKMYQAYLQAIILGYPAIHKDLGQTVTIKIDDFPLYITDETKACFIDVVTLYYDCPLTRLGITLVDTPGADSVNARHTSVAFDYIKQADAILYVTYYNHALSRADRDFLMQLGRVKDAFQLDKMFFIINAADLAESKDDLQLVIDYVETQLLHLGIRFPKIFPVSSKQSLENKLNNHQLNGQMQAFETMFYQFINEDLAALSIQSILWDIDRAYQDLTNYMQTIHLNAQEKEQFRHDLEQTRTLLEQVIDEREAHTYEERIMQRVERQLHYVKQRIVIRFHDLFKDTFNPITITASGIKVQQQLEKNLRNLVDDTGYEMLQELRAVSLRVESFLKTLTAEVHKDFQARSQAIDQKFSLPMVDITDLETPAYEQAFPQLDIQPFSRALSRFKGTKAFFEKNEKDAMREELFELIAPAIQQYIVNNQEIMDQAYMSQWYVLFENSQHQVSTHIQNYIENSLMMITDTGDINVLEEKQQILASIIEASNKKG